MITWALLGAAVFFGIFAQARLPVMMGEKTYNLEHGPFVWPTRIHQLTFFAAIGCLMWSLILLLFHEPSADKLTIRNVAEVARAAEHALPSTFSVRKLETAEPVAGREKDSLSETLWHIKFSGKELQGKKQEDKTYDVLVLSDSGHASIVEAR